MRALAQRGINILLLLISGFTLLSGCSGAPLKPEPVAPGDYGYVKEYTSRLISEEMKKHEVTGLSIALVDGQRVIWAQGFGYADKANEVPATPETVYRVGSISKLFTVTEAMRLSEQGRVTIDKPLRTYLPEFSIKTRFPHAAEITPRNIMTHHSGLPSNLYKGMWTKTPEPFTNLVEELKDEYAAYPPNFLYSYSNLGMTLLGHMIARVSGEDFGHHMDSSLLRPLGMTHSFFSMVRDPLLSKGYMDGGETDDPPLRDLPAGGLTSNVLDLSRFIQMVFSGGRAGDHQILKPETVVEMLRPQNTDVPLDLNFRVGLGWALSGLGNINIRNAGPVAHHNGATLFFHSQLIVLPEHKLGVVVLSNSASSRSVVDKVAVEALLLALEAKTGIKQPPQIKPVESSGPLPEAVLQTYEGRYATVLGPAGITRKADSLQSEVADTTFQLVPRSDGLLGLKYKLLGLIPISISELDEIGISRASVAGHDVLIAHSGDQDLLVGERITPVTVSEKWRQRVGAYEVVNADDDMVLPKKIRLRYDDGFLIMEYVMSSSYDVAMGFVIVPVSENEAVIAGLGRDMGETIRVITANGEEGLQYSGYRFKKKAGH